MVNSIIFVTLKKIGKYGKEGDRRHSSSDYY